MLSDRMTYRLGDTLGHLLRALAFNAGRREPFGLRWE
jgi:hypothetical protein